MDMAKKLKDWFMSKATDVMASIASSQQNQYQHHHEHHASSSLSPSPTSSCLSSSSPSILEQQETLEQIQPSQQPSQSKHSTGIIAIAPRKIALSRVTRHHASTPAPSLFEALIPSRIFGLGFGLGKRSRVAVVGKDQKAEQEHHQGEVRPVEMIDGVDMEGPKKKQKVSHLVSDDILPARDMLPIPAPALPPPASVIVSSPSSSSTDASLSSECIAAPISLERLIEIASVLLNDEEKEPKATTSQEDKEAPMNLDTCMNILWVLTESAVMHSEQGGLCGGTMSTNGTTKLKPSLAPKDTANMKRLLLDSQCVCPFRPQHKEDSGSSSLSSSDCECECTSCHHVHCSRKGQPLAALSKVIMTQECVQNAYLALFRSGQVQLDKITGLCIQVIQFELKRWNRRSDIQKPSLASMAAVNLLSLLMHEAFAQLPSEICQVNAVNALCRLISSSTVIRHLDDEEQIAQNGPSPRPEAEPSPSFPSITDAALWTICQTKSDAILSECCDNLALVICAVAHTDVIDKASKNLSFHRLLVYVLDITNRLISVYAAKHLNVQQKWISGKAKRSKIAKDDRKNVAKESCPQQQFVEFLVFRVSRMCLLDVSAIQTVAMMTFRRFLADASTGNLPEGMARDFFSCVELLVLMEVCSMPSDQSPCSSVPEYPCQVAEPFQAYLESLIFERSYGFEMPRHCFVSLVTQPRPSSIGSTGLSTFGSRKVLEALRCKKRAEWWNLVLWIVLDRFAAALRSEIDPLAKNLGIPLTLNVALGALNTTNGLDAQQAAATNDEVFGSDKKAKWMHSHYTRKSSKDAVSSIRETGFAGNRDDDDDHGDGSHSRAYPVDNRPWTGPVVFEDPSEFSCYMELVSFVVLNKTVDANVQLQGLALLSHLCNYIQLCGTSALTKSELGLIILRYSAIIFLKADDPVKLSFLRSLCTTLKYYNKELFSVEYTPSKSCEPARGGNTKLQDQVLNFGWLFESETKSIDSVHCAPILSPVLHDVSNEASKIASSAATQTWINRDAPECGLGMLEALMIVWCRSMATLRWTKVPTNQAAARTQSSKKSSKKREISVFEQGMADILCAFGFSPRNFVETSYFSCFSLKVLDESSKGIIEIDGLPPTSGSNQTSPLHRAAFEDILHLWIMLGDVMASSLMTSCLGKFANQEQASLLLRSTLENVAGFLLFPLRLVTRWKLVQDSMNVPTAKSLPVKSAVKEPLSIILSVSTPCSESGLSLEPIVPRGCIAVWSNLFHQMIDLFRKTESDPATTVNSPTRSPTTSCTPEERQVEQLCQHLLDGFEECLNMIPVTSSEPQSHIKADEKGDLTTSNVIELVVSSCRTILDGLGALESVVARDRSAAVLHRAIRLLQHLSLIDLIDDSLDKKRSQFGFTKLSSSRNGPSKEQAFARNIVSQRAISHVFVSYLALVHTGPLDLLSLPEPAGLARGMSKTLDLQGCRTLYPGFFESANAMLPTLRQWNKKGACTKPLETFVEFYCRSVEDWCRASRSWETFEQAVLKSKDFIDFGLTCSVTSCKQRTADFVQTVKEMMMSARNNEHKKSAAALILHQHDSMIFNGVLYGEVAQPVYLVTPYTTPLHKQHSRQRGVISFSADSKQLPLKDTVSVLGAGRSKDSIMDLVEDSKFRTGSSRPKNTMISSALYSMTSRIDRLPNQQGSLNRSGLPSGYTGSLGSFGISARRQLRFTPVKSLANRQLQAATANKIAEDAVLPRDGNLDAASAGGSGEASPLFPVRITPAPGPPIWSSARPHLSSQLRTQAVSDEMVNPWPPTPSALALDPENSDSSSFSNSPNVTPMVSHKILKCNPQERALVATLSTPSVLRKRRMEEDQALWSACNAPTNKRTKKQVRFHLA